MNKLEIKALTDRTIKEPHLPQTAGLTTPESPEHVDTEHNNH